MFLATEDLSAISMFREEFGDRLFLYDDVFRVEGDVGPHSTPSGRPLHRYRLGLEVLRDMYTLAACRGLVCGLSHTAFAARYISLAAGHKFESLKVLDNGINL